MKRFLILAIALLLLQSAVIKPVRGTINVPLFKVEVTPNNAGSVGQYRIYGSYCEYDSINTLKIYFRDDTRSSIYFPNGSSVLVNGVPVKYAIVRELEVARSFQDYSVEMTLTLSQYLNRNTPIEILIKKEAGIINPLAPATCYKLRIVYINNKGVEVDSTITESYVITVSAVSNVRAVVYKPIKLTKSAYLVTFFTGDKGYLNAGNDEIRVKFPQGTIFPYALGRTSVLVNEKESYGVYRDENDPYVLRIYSYDDIRGSSYVSIMFKESFGLINPSAAGEYKILVSTSKEPSWVESEPFTIYEPEIQDLQVTVSPDSIALKSEIRLSFKTSPTGYLQAGSYIYLSFPQGFELAGADPSGRVRVGGVLAEAIMEGGTLKIRVPFTVPALTTVEVHIDAEAGFKNPTSPGSYTFAVWTDADNSKANCSVEIEDSSVSEASLNVSCSGLGAKDTFLIAFKTGPVYSLAKSVDAIIVRFDEGFGLPQVPLQGIVRVNDITCSIVSFEGRDLVIIVPEDIFPSAIVKIEIPDSFGITNPLVIGNYGVQVATSKEPAFVQTNKVEMKQLPVVEFTVSPSLPDGINGFYRTNPEIMLSTSNGTKVFYKLDDGEFAEFKSAIRILEGAHKVYAYAVDSGGNKGDVIVKEFIVDTTPPEIKFENVDVNPVFKGSPGKLKGSVSEPCTLKINEAVLEIDKDNLIFEVEINVAEGMPIVVYARDLAGNAKSLIFTAHIDKVSPNVSFVEDTGRIMSFGQSSGAVIETTNSSYTIRMKLDEKGKIFVNGNEASFDGQIFSYMAYLSDGDNAFSIRAVDIAGNESNYSFLVRKVNEKKIVLQVGSTSAIVGGNIVELDAPPFIENGTTLVPIRFISETFGATVEWNDALKVITIRYGSRAITLQIGSTVAIVDGNINNLSVAPKIQNNRTYVPLRFISEAFGAQVEWEGQTKTITITYKP